MADKTWVVNGTMKKMPSTGVAASAVLRVQMVGPGGTTNDIDFPFVSTSNGVYGFEFTVEDTWTIVAADVKNIAPPWLPTPISGGHMGTISGNNLPITTAFVSPLP